MGNGSSVRKWAVPRWPYVPWPAPCARRGGHTCRTARSPAWAEGLMLELHDPQGPPRGTRGQRVPDPGRLLYASPLQKQVRVPLLARRLPSGVPRGRVRAQCWAQKAGRGCQARSLPVAPEGPVAPRLPAPLPSCDTVSQVGHCQGPGRGSQAGPGATPEVSCIGLAPPPTPAAHEGRRGPHSPRSELGATPDPLHIQPGRRPHFISAREKGEPLATAHDCTQAQKVTLGSLRGAALSPTPGARCCSGHFSGLSSHRRMYPRSSPRVWQLTQGSPAARAQNPPRL